MEPRDRPSDTMGPAACAACGRHVPSTRVRVLARRENLTFAELPCTGCGSTGLAIFLADGRPEWDRDEHPAAPGRHAITAADVRAMHELLASWTGDLHGLLRRASEDAPGRSGPA